MSTCKIAKLCETSIGTIVYFLKKHNILRRSIGEAQTKIGNITKEWLKEKYLIKKMNAKEIGLIANVSKYAIYEWLKQFNIPIRTNSESHKGQVMSEETRKKISILSKGLKRSPETRRKISLAKRGENNPAWQGGIYPLRKKIRHSYKYRQWRDDVFTRDEFTCQECGNKGIYLQAHHINKISSILHFYEITILEDAYECMELWNINNGITLCKKCHKKIHQKEVLKYVNSF